MSYQHPEAYSLMHYTNKNRTVTERLWNARDGVTPFIIGSVDGKHELTHQDWASDRRDIVFVPPVGSRVFLDLTLDAARVYRRQYVEKYWDKEVHGSKMSERTDLWKTPEEAVEYLAKNDYAQGGAPGKAPDIVIVDERLHKLFLERAQTIERVLSIPANPRFA